MQLNTVEYYRDIAWLLCETKCWSRFGCSTFQLGKADRSTKERRRKHDKKWQSRHRLSTNFNHEGTRMRERENELQRRGTKHTMSCHVFAVPGVKEQGEWETMGKYEHAYKPAIEPVTADHRHNGLHWWNGTLARIWGSTKCWGDCMRRGTRLHMHMCSRRLPCWVALARGIGIVRLEELTWSKYPCCWYSLLKTDRTGTHLP